MSTFNWRFWLAGLALIASLILSILSWLEICVEHCSANQDYRLFGFPFAIVGLIFFSMLNVFHFSSRRYLFLSQIVGWMIAAALGAELMFIIVQKYQIGHWCPVCLSIAFSVAIAALVLWTGSFRGSQVTHQNGGRKMQKIKKNFTFLSFVVLGFLISFIGISKFDAVEAATQDIKEKIGFGNSESLVEVYFVTDWFCPSCHKVESEIEKIYPKIKSKVTFYFIDYPIHKKSLNFTPYNLSFLIYNKPQYFKARDMLLALSDKTEAPTDEEVSEAAQKNGFKFKELSYLEVKTGTEYFDKVIDKYNIKATPTLIITNPHRNQTVKLEGRNEISEESIMHAIEKLTPPK